MTPFRRRIGSGLVLLLLGASGCTGSADKEPTRTSSGQTQTKKAGILTTQAKALLHRPKLIYEPRSAYAYSSRLEKLPWSTDIEGRSGYCFMSSLLCRMIIDEDVAVGARKRVFIAPAPNEKLVLPAEPEYELMPRVKVEGFLMARTTEETCTSTGVQRTDIPENAGFLALSHLDKPTCLPGVIEREVAKAIDAVIKDMQVQRADNKLIWFRNKRGETALLQVEVDRFRLCVVRRTVKHTADNPDLPPIFSVPYGKTYANVVIHEVRASKFEPIEKLVLGQPVDPEPGYPETETEWVEDTGTMLWTAKGFDDTILPIYLQRG
jgi:hypothetical protein